MPSQNKWNQLRKKRIINKIYLRRNNVSVNNEDVLNRIANLPQQTSDNSLIHQFFNGVSFYQRKNLNFSNYLIY